MFENLKIDALENRRFIRAKYAVTLTCTKVQDGDTNTEKNFDHHTI